MRKDSQSMAAMRVSKSVVPTVMNILVDIVWSEGVREWRSDGVMEWLVTVTVTVVLQWYACGHSQWQSM